MLIKYLSLCSIILALFYFIPGNAQVTVTFVGGGADNKITTNANWSSGSKPVVNNADITIAAGKTMVVDENFTCKTLRINAGSSFSCNGGILTITEGIYDENGVKKIDIKSSLQINSSIKLAVPITATSGTFTDARDEIVYKWVKIGNQIWMAENLKATKYNDETDIPLVTDNSAWNALLTPGYCWYNNDEATNKNTYGALYNWYTVNTGKLCPTGWHAPSDAEWTELTDYLDANGHFGNGGTALKTTSGWASGGNGTNVYGFSCLPGGYRDVGGNFGGVGSGSYIWSATDYGSLVYYRYLLYNVTTVGRDANNKKVGFSVRCVKN